MFVKPKNKLIVLLIVLLFATLLIAVPKVKASTLFEDNFDNGNSDKWMVIGNSGWNIQNGKYGIFLDPGLSNTVPTDENWNNTWTSISFDVDITGTAGVDKNILLKFKDIHNFLEIHANDNGIFLDKASSSGGAGVQDSSPMVLQNNQTYHFHSEINEDKIKVYINNILLFDDTESFPSITNWKIGLRAGTGAVSPTEVWFDNVVVSELPTPTLSPSPTPTITPTSTPTPTATPVSLNVPDIKQFSPPWNNQIYDNAKSWSTNPTINRWGCALTSVDMVLNYYGFNVTPGQLNTWLISQPDGYIGNGLLNWLAISRYTKITPNSPISLEFLRLSNNTNNLINELTNNRPAILEEPGHFVVAKSIINNTFGINDPGYSNHPTLTSYNNSFASIESYVPSHTNLSYIMLVIKPQFDIKVFDTEGNEILGHTFIQNPLIDDIDNINTSGSPLKIFMFPKPEGGMYKVKILGKGIYELGSYLYNSEGSVNLNKFDGIIGDNQIDEFKLTIGQTNTTNQTITIDNIIEDWENAKAQNKIFKNNVYEEIKIILKIARNLINHHNNKLAKISLIAGNLLIKNYTLKYIDSSTSEIIQTEINIVLKSL